MLAWSALLLVFSARRAVKTATVALSPHHASSMSCVAPAGNTADLPSTQPVSEWPSLCDISMPFRLPPLGMALIPNYFDLCCSVSRTTGVRVNDLTSTDESGIRVMHPCLAGVICATLTHMNESQLDELRSRARHAAFLCRGVGHRTQEQIRQRRAARQKADPPVANNGATQQEQVLPDFQIPWVSNLELAPPLPPLPPLFQQLGDSPEDASLDPMDPRFGGPMQTPFTDLSTSDSRMSTAASSAIVPELNNTGFSIQRIHTSASAPVYFPAPNAKVQPVGVDLSPWVPVRTVSPRLYARTIPLLPGYRDVAAAVSTALGCCVQDLYRSQKTVRYMHPRLAAEVRGIMAGLSDDEIAEIGVKGRAMFKKYRDRHEKRAGYKRCQPHAKRNRKGIRPIPSVVAGLHVPVVYPIGTAGGQVTAAQGQPTPLAVLDHRTESAFSTPVRVPTPLGQPAGALQRTVPPMPEWMAQIIMDARATGAAKRTA